MAEDIRPHDAVRAAKRWLADLYADEDIGRIGLEGVRFREGNWEIVLGFSRGVPDLDDNAASTAGLLISALNRPQRVYKTVVVSGNDNHIIELRDREVA
jgi:hypothetical protein